MTCEYIYIYKGDDTDWNDEQLLTVNINPGSPTIDFSEMTATFILGSYEKKNISLASGSFIIDLGAAVTGAFPYGAIMGSIKILDSDQRVKTVANKIPFMVTNDVITLQNRNFVIDLPQCSINITVGGTVSYNNISDKPSINGTTIEGAHDAEYYNLATKTGLDNHISDTNNPHEVTKLQVGLGNVDNTSDLDKPISTATQTALNGKVSKSGDTMTGDLTLASGVSIKTATGKIYEDDVSNIIIGDENGNGFAMALDGAGAAIIYNNGQAVTDVITQREVLSTYNTSMTNPVNSVAVQSAISTKQDALSTAQLSAVNSGIDSSKVAQIATNTNNISIINGKIPTQASTTNQLADKKFVNSSISTNTANFIGTFNSVAELEAYSGTLTNNDYAFVASTDSAGNTVYDRYKYTTATIPASWEFEYELNNSSFTATQWAAINSGATSANIGQIATNTSDITSLQNTKLDANTAASTYLTQTDAASTYLSQSTAASTYSTQTSLTNGLATKQDTLVSGTNIKTINNTSLLGSGNIDIQGGSGTDYTAGTGISIQNVNVVKVVSGFDGYKTIQLVNTNPAYPKPTSSFEFVTRVKQTSEYNSAILGNGNDDPSGGGIFMRTTDSDPLGLHCWGTYSNSNFDIDNFDTGVEFTLNTWAWVKCIWDGSDYTWYQKADSDTLWTQRNSLTSVACSAPYITQIGATGNNTSWYWHGVIDITNTYIKVDDTKVFDGADSTQWTATGLTITEEQGPGASVETQIAIANPFVSYIQDGAVAKMNLQTVVDASGLASNTGAVHALDLDLSENKKLTKLTAKGTSGNLVNLSDVLVSNFAPFNNVTSPQIDVSYSNLSKNALVNLFNSLPYNSGYTVVGSVTISNGVVSGFSEGNGLQISNFPAASADWEIVVKADTTFNNAQQRLISCGGMYLRVIGSSNTWNLYVAGSTEKWADSADTYPYIKIRKKGSYIDLFQSSDGGVYTLKASNISIGTVTDDNLDIGNSSAYWNGNFYLNASSITVNGLPYFNGQAFMTKTCNIVGCAGISELEQTDKDIALDKGWSLTVA